MDMEKVVERFQQGEGLAGRGLLRDCEIFEFEALIDRVQC